MREKNPADANGSDHGAMGMRLEEAQRALRLTAGY
jgi:hypothetical protein